MLTMKYLEVLWTGTKHKFMCFNELAFSSQSYINQYFFLQQTVKHSHESTMVIVPFQAEFVVGVHRTVNFKTNFSLSNLEQPKET